MKISHRVFAGLVSSLSLVSSVGWAGYDYGSPAGGVSNADGSGYCSGTLNGFRTTSDATAEFVFQDYADLTGASRYVACQIGGHYHFAGLNQSNAAIWALFGEAVTAPQTTNLYIHWNTSGVVDAIQIFNTSYYH